MIKINTIILRHGFGEITSKGDTIWGDEYVIRWKAIPGWTGGEDEPGACNWMAPALAKNARTDEDVTAICDVEDAHTW